MASVVKIRRVANPRRRRRNARAGRSARTGRFVRITRKRARVKRAKSGRFVRVRNARRHRVRRRRTVNRRRHVRVNPVRRRRRVRHTAKRVNRRRRSIRRNPVLIELGAINPTRRRRKSSVARRRRRAHNRRRHSRRRNPVAVVHRRRRHHVRRRHNRRHYSRRYRRNPMGMTSGDMMTTVVGGLIGMAAVKFLPTLVPASMMSALPSSPFVTILVTGAGAFLAGFIAQKVAPKWGRAVLVGGLIQTGSVALNALAPGIASSLALSGFGDIIPTMPFPVPNNQMKPMLVAAPSSGMQGVGANIRRRVR